VMMICGPMAADLTAAGAADHQKVRPINIRNNVMKYFFI
jgi:hypothetical protein